MKLIALHNDLPLLAATTLQAGKLHCLYEQGTLRYIRWGGTELIRMMYCAVRNASWDTVPYTISAESIDAGPDSFAISYTAHYALGELRYQTDCHISGNADGVISFQVDGVAQSDFLRNRIGICVHHPLVSCMGQEVRVTHPNGILSAAAFPRTISPHQPLTQIRALNYNTPQGHAISLRFAGEIFETEDQRNWGDASFKTYGTPLALPMPVSVRKGERLQQSVQLEVTRFLNRQPPGLEPMAEMRLPFPAIGYCWEDAPVPEEAAQLLQQVPCQHLYVPLVLVAPQWQAQLRRAAVLAQQVPVPLLLAVVFGEQFRAEGEELLAAVAAGPAPVRQLLVLEAGKPVASAQLFAAIANLFEQNCPQVSVGWGTHQNFAELNRNIPEGAAPGFASFGLNPQVHASDTRSVWENLHSMPHLLATLQQRLPGVPVMVGPVALRNMLLLNRTGPHYLLPDERQYRFFTALWTLAAIGKLAGAAGLTLFSCFGPRGLATCEGTRWHKSPLFEVLHTIRAFNPVWIITETNEVLKGQEKLILENAAGERLQFLLEVPGFWMP